MFERSYIYNLDVEKVKARTSLLCRNKNRIIINNDFKNIIDLPPNKLITMSNKNTLSIILVEK